MVAPGCRHASLIPSLPFARRIAAPVQHRGNLVITVANSHATNDLQRLQRRASFGCGTRAPHRELGMRTSLPVNYQLKGLFVLSVRTMMSSMAVRKIIFLSAGGQRSLCQTPA